MHSKTGWKWVLVLDVSIYQGVSEEAGLWHNGLGETRGWDWGCPHFPPISLLLRRQWWPTQELEVVPKCATKEQFKAQRVALTSHQYRRHWEDSKRFNHQYHCYWYRIDGKRFKPTPGPREEGNKEHNWPHLCYTLKENDCMIISASGCRILVQVVQIVSQNWSWL